MKILVIMRFLVTLIFSFHFLVSADNQDSTTEADCNDKDIFHAVDVALRHYNDKKESGNQFVLHRITDARTMPGSNGGTHNYVKYQVHEGSCGVKSGIEWQECDFNEPVEEPMNCSAHVFVEKDLNITIISQNCTSRQVETQMIPLYCLGCYNTIDIHSTEVSRLIEFAIHRMNQIGSHPFHFNLQQIQSAHRQVVHGWNYWIVYTIRQTNCSKSLFNNVSSEECALDQSGQSALCHTKVFVTPDDQIKDISPGCRTDSGFCLDCPGDVDPNDPKIVHILRQVIDKYNADNNHTNLFNISHINKATEKGTKNFFWEISFDIKETNCSRSEYAILEDDCHFTGFGIMSCDARFNVTNKDILINSSLQCYESQPVVQMSYIRGNTPFRMSNRHRHVVRHTQAYEESNGEEHSMNHEEDQHVKRDNNEKTKETKHNSYKESQELKGILPEAEFTEATMTIAPKCPGTLWKPKKNVNIFLELPDTLDALEDYTAQHDVSFGKEVYEPPQQAHSVDDSQVTNN
ncbi:kininogen-1 isoform 2-T2 [Discoglossus pictus]